MPSKPNQHLEMKVRQSGWYSYVANAQVSVCNLVLHDTGAMGEQVYLASGDTAEEATREAVATLRALADRLERGES